MKMMPWLVFISLCLVGCSGSKSAQKVTEETPQVELSEADEFLENNTEEAAATAETPAEATDEMVTEVTDADVPTEEASTEEPAVEMITNTTEQTTVTKKYTVQKNETLMMISFKVYGDYSRWKEIANQNATVLKGENTLTPGMELEYIAPMEEFVWSPQGNPYLIKTGDTLGRISKEVYSSMSKWKLIWDNNRPLIKNPNKIYSGFTIYYLDGNREVATEI